MKKYIKHKDVMALKEAIVKALIMGASADSLINFTSKINKEISELDATKSKIFGTLKVTHKCYSDFLIEDMLSGWGLYFSEVVTLQGINSIEEFTEGLLKVALDKIVHYREEKLAEAKAYAAKYQSTII